MKDTSRNIDYLKKKIKKFMDERDWEQYHSPKNLVMGLSIEVSELMEHFLWLTDEETRAIVNDEKKMNLIKDELADIFIYCFNMASAMDIDVTKSVLRKLETTAEKYPVEKVKGRREKYTEY